MLLGGTLAVRGLVRLRAGQPPRLRLDRVEGSIVVMAICSSVVPLLWMTLRQVPITKDDVLYALVLWKYLGLYAIIRLSVSSEPQVRRCLSISVGAASIVAMLAVLQSLGLFGVPRILATYYAPFGYANAFQARGSFHARPSGRDGGSGDLQPRHRERVVAQVPPAPASPRRGGDPLCVRQHCPPASSPAPSGSS